MTSFDNLQGAPIETMGQHQRLDADEELYVEEHELYHQPQYQDEQSPLETLARRSSPRYPNIEYQRKQTEPLHNFQPGTMSQSQLDHRPGLVGFGLQRSHSRGINKSQWAKNRRGEDIGARLHE